MWQDKLKFYLVWFQSLLRFLERNRSECGDVHITEYNVCDSYSVRLRPRAKMTQRKKHRSVVDRLSSEVSVSYSMVQRYKKLTLYVQHSK